VTRARGVWCASLLLLSSAKCGSARKDLPVRPDTTAESENAGVSRDSLHYVELGKPFEQRVDSAALRNGPYKLVEVEVVDVWNPKRHQVTFEVSYRPSRGDETRLGEFSLYPPDNPGRFVVATQGRVRDAGTLVLSISSPDHPLTEDVIKAGVRALRLTNSF
jgi:hypothetical protein